jgi:hypothetical protein
MNDALRVVAVLAIEEIDNKLRVLTEGKDAATSGGTQAVLDLRIEILIHERCLWEDVLDLGYRTAS